MPAGSTANARRPVVRFHTDRKNMREILGITEQNAHLCPAVSSIVQSILDEVND